ncbi:hypothetical protein BVX98_03340 [bacterium F11]|nr:hypothetical protein BVX98_03340 [bacterium F11]
MTIIKKWLNKIDWSNTSFLAVAHLFALGGAWFLFSFDLIRWQTILLTLFMVIATGLAITVGYHRLFSHKTFQANSLVKLLLLLFGAAAFQNSARRWSSDHRRHHKYVDTDRDPYNIKRGFLFAHMGWILLKYDRAHSYDDVPDLLSDSLVRFQEKYYLSLAIAVGFLFPTLVASIWGDPLGGFFMAGWIRLVLNEHFTFSINSFAHIFGSQPYSDADTSRDNWLFAFFTYGEGYHNFHHKFPFDYRNGIKFYQWDPSKWLIKGLARLGWVSSLRQAPKEIILQARLKMDEKRMVQRLEHVVVPGTQISRELVFSARLKFEQAYVRFQTIKKEYAILRKEKMEVFQTQLHLFNEKMETMKMELLAARQTLEEAMATWVELCSGLGVPPTKASV